VEVFTSFVLYRLVMKIIFPCTCLAMKTVLTCVLFLCLLSPTNAAPMKRHVFEKEHKHPEQTEEDPHFFKMVYVKIMNLLKQEEYAKKHLEAANKVIDDTQDRMKEKSMDILGKDRHTDMDTAQEMLASYRHMGPEDMFDNFGIVKTTDTTEELVQLTIDTNIFLVQNLIKALKLTEGELGISAEEMKVVQAADTEYFQGEASVVVMEDTPVDRADTQVGDLEDEEAADDLEDEEAADPVEEESDNSVENEEPLTGINPKMKVVQKPTSPKPRAKAKKSGSHKLGGLVLVNLVCLLVLFL